MANNLGVVEVVTIRNFFHFRCLLIFVNKRTRWPPFLDLMIFNMIAITNRLLFFLLNIFISVSSLYGQNQKGNGYIINLENDTIYGALNLASTAVNYSKAIITIAGERKKFGPAEIRGYGERNGKTYLASGDSAFVEVLLRGKASLYRIHNVFLLQVDNSPFYILKSERMVKTRPGGQTYIEYDDSWKEACKYLLMNCKEVRDDIETTDFREPSLVKLVSQYNHCVNSGYTEFKGSIPWAQLEFGLTGGVVQTKINVHHKGDLTKFLPKSYTSTSFIGGIPITILFPRSYDRFSVQFEVLFQKSEFNGDVTLDNEPVDTRYFKTRIDITSLSIPVAINYALGNGKIVPFVQLGFAFDMNMSRSNTLDRETVIDDVLIKYPQETPYEINPFQLGGLFGAGVRKNFNGFAAIGTFRYIVLSRFENSPDFDAPMNKILFTVAIMRRR